MTTNKIYQAPEVATVFKNTGGDVLMTLKNTAAGHGRVSDIWDRGAGAKAMRLKIEVCIKAAAAGATISLPYRVYAFAADDAGRLDFTADADLTNEFQLANYSFVGQVIASGVWPGTSAGPFYGSIIVEIYGRYVSLGIWNASGQGIEDVDGSSYIIVTPYPDDIQPAA